MKDNFDASKWFKNQYLIEDESNEMIGKVHGNMNLDYLLDKYSLSEILDYITSQYDRMGESNASSLVSTYAKDFREKGLTPE
tara:strand:+ start:4903 stop:5148 length:246 start_codon:yes stop_codon:yes gene_type:complete